MFYVFSIYIKGFKKVCTSVPEPIFCVTLHLWFQTVNDHCCRYQNEKKISSQVFIPVRSLVKKYMTMYCMIFQKSLSPDLGAVKNSLNRTLWWIIEKNIHRINLWIFFLWKDFMSDLTGNWLQIQESNLLFLGYEPSEMTVSLICCIIGMTGLYPYHGLTPDVPWLYHSNLWSERFVFNFDMNRPVSSAAGIAPAVFPNFYCRDGMGLNAPLCLTYRRDSFPFLPQSYKRDTDIYDPSSAGREDFQQSVPIAMLNPYRRLRAACYSVI